MQAFLETAAKPKNLFKQTEAILFFGTPFQGMDKWFTDEMPALAKIKNAQVDDSILRLLALDSNILRKLREDFLDKLVTYQSPGIGCFYETKNSNISKIVDRLELDKEVEINREHVKLVLQDSATFPSSATLSRRSKRALPSDHFDINEFGENDNNFFTVKQVLHEIISDEKRSAILQWKKKVAEAELSLSEPPGPSTNTLPSLPGNSIEKGNEPHQSGKYFFTSCNCVRGFNIK